MNISNMFYPWLALEVITDASVGAKCNSSPFEGGGWSRHNHIKLFLKNLNNRLLLCSQAQCKGLVLTCNALQLLACPHT